MEPILSTNVSPMPRVFPNVPEPRPSRATPDEATLDRIYDSTTRLLRGASLSDTRVSDASRDATPSAPERDLDLDALIVSVFGNPDLALAAIDRTLRDSQVESGVDAVQTNRTTSERASRERADAQRRARRAARRATRFLGQAPKWVKKLVEAIVVAAGAAATAVSGGAAAGLAIAGAVLILGADGFTKLAEKLGMDPSKAKWIGVACKIAGAALMAGGAGASAGGAAPTAPAGSPGMPAPITPPVADAARIAETLKHVQQVVSAVRDVVDGVRGIGHSAATFASTQAEADAQSAALRGDLADDATEDGVDGMRALLASATRRADAVAEVERTKREVADAVVRRLA